MGGQLSTTKRKTVSIEPPTVRRPENGDTFDSSLLFRRNEDITPRVYATEDEDYINEMVSYGYPIARQDGRLAYASLVPSKTHPGFFNAHVDAFSYNQYMSAATTAANSLPEELHEQSRTVCLYPWNLLPPITTQNPAAPVLLPTCVNFTEGAAFSYPHLFSSIAPMMATAYIRNFASHADSVSASVALRTATQRSGVLPLHNVVSHLSYGFARSAIRYYRREAPVKERKVAFVDRTYIHTPRQNTQVAPIRLFTYYDRPAFPWVNIGLETFVAATTLSLPMHIFHYKHMMDRPHIYPSPSSSRPRPSLGNFMYTFFPTVLSLAQISAVDACASYFASLFADKEAAAMSIFASTAVGSYAAALAALPLASFIIFRDTRRLARVGEILHKRDAVLKYLNCSAALTGITTLVLQLSDMHAKTTLTDLAIAHKHKELYPHAERRYGEGELLSHYNKIGALPIWRRHRDS